MFSTLNFVTDDRHDATAQEKQSNRESFLESDVVDHHSAFLDYALIAHHADLN